MPGRCIPPAWACLGLLLGIGCGGRSPALYFDPATNGAFPAPGDAAPSEDVPASPAEAHDAPAEAHDALAEAHDAPAEVSGERDTPATRDTAASDEEDAEASPDGVPGCGPSPWVLVDAIPNVRQLAGIPLAAGGVVACNLIFRGSSLASLTTEGCQKFAATGIRTVIDLRSVSEQTSPPATCVLQQSRVVSAPLPVPSNVSPTDYLAILYSAPSMRTVFAILADEASYPVYYNCLYGRDRTGVVTAVILSALGATRSVIEREYALTVDAGFAVYPQSLAAVLDEIERLGGIDEYLRLVEIPADQVQAVRRILVPPPTAP